MREITHIGLILGISSRTGISAVIKTYFGLKIIKCKKKTRIHIFHF
jgi:hypothetical protein